MTKKSKKTVLAVVAVLAVALIGVSVYALAQNNSEKPAENVSKTCTTYNDTIAEQCSEDYLGLNDEVAINTAKANGLFPKVVKIDGEEQIFTYEGAAAIYFEVENGIVTSAYFPEQ